MLYTRLNMAEVPDEEIVEAKTLEEANAAMEAGKYVACEDANFVSQANLVEMCD